MSRKTILSILGALSLGLLFAGCGRETASRGRVVLIGLDGASWNLLDPMVKAGELPHFKTLMERGVSADLASVPPFLSPAVWTSIATSRRPADHGVLYFYSNRHAIRVPTIWDRLAAGGLRVGLYDYLVTWPPRRFPHGGFSVPGWLRRDESVWPPDLFQRIGLPRYAYAVVDVGGPEDIIANSERELRDKPRTWNRLWDELQPDVGAVTFYALDVLSHRFWHTLADDGSPRPGASGPGILPRTARGIDRAIGEIVDNLAPEDTLLIVSDHGFQAGREARRRWGFDTRRLLQRAGIEPGRERLTILSGFGSLSIRIEPDHLERDPPATIEAARAPRLPDEKDGAAGAGEDAETREKLRALGYIQ